MYRGTRAVPYRSSTMLTLIIEGEQMNELYETKISNAQWIAYDISGNIGWIAWITCTIICMKDSITLFPVLSVFPALCMVVGVTELISERIVKLSRVLPKARVWRGFGALLLGGIIGIPVAVIGLLLRANGLLPWCMLAGSVLCAVFAGLCFAGYRKQ